MANNTGSETILGHGERVHEDAELDSLITRYILDPGSRLVIIPIRVRDEEKAKAGNQAGWMHDFSSHKKPSREAFVSSSATVAKRQTLHR